MESTEDIKLSTRSPLADAWAELQAHADRGEPLQADAYRLAFADPEFLLRRDARGIRIQLEMLKPELDLTESRGGAHCRRVRQRPHPAASDSRPAAARGKGLGRTQS